MALRTAAVEARAVLLHVVFGAAAHERLEVAALQPAEPSGCLPPAPSATRSITSRLKASRRSGVARSAGTSGLAAHHAAADVEADRAHGHRASPRLVRMTQPTGTP